MHLFNRHKTCQKTSSIALIAMLFQLVLATFHVPLAMAMDDTFDVTSDGNQTIVICTASGIKRITIDAEGNAIDEKQLGGNQNSCSHCSAACDLTCNISTASLRHTDQTSLSYSQYEYGLHQDRTPNNSGGLDPPRQI